MDLEAAKHSHFSPLKATVCMQVKASDLQDGGEGQTGPGQEVAEEMK